MKINARCSKGTNLSISSSSTFINSSGWLPLKHTTDNKQPDLYYAIIAKTSTSNIKKTGGVVLYSPIRYQFTDGEDGSISMDAVLDHNSGERIQKYAAGFYQAYLKLDFTF